MKLKCGPSRRVIEFSRILLMFSILESFSWILSKGEAPWKKVVYS